MLGRSGAQDEEWPSAPSGGQTNNKHTRKCPMERMFCEKKSKEVNVIENAQVRKIPSVVRKASGKQVFP